MSQGQRILVVEDEIVVAMDIQNSLESWGYEVVDLVTTGEAAISAAKDNRPDLILMDIRLKGNLDGTETAFQIRSEIDVPVIFLTAHTDDHLVDRSKASQPYGYIVKPFEDRELQITIDLALYKHKMERKLRAREEQYRRLADLMNEGLAELDVNGQLVYANHRLCEMLGLSWKDLEGRLAGDFMDEAGVLFLKRQLGRLLSADKKSCVVNLLGQEGLRIATILSLQTVFDVDQNIQRAIAVFTDVSELKAAQEELKKANDELEQKVQARTEELEFKTTSLEEVNTALKVLLDKREEDKQKLQKQVLSNIKELVDPYIAKIRRTTMDARQSAFIDIMESNLKDIVSPFARTLATRDFNLTPAEMQIANLIKQGKSTKFIAELLNLSSRTIESHRRNIRIKLGLKNKKANMRTYLMSLD